MNAKRMAVLLLIFSIAAWTQAQEEKNQILFECQVFRVPGHLSGEVSKEIAGGGVRNVVKGPPNLVQGPRSAEISQGVVPGGSNKAPSKSVSDLDLEKEMTFTFFEEAKFDIGKNRLEAGRNGWFWNGAAMDLTSRTVEGTPDLLLISAPRLLVPYGERAKFRIGSDQGLEYFERREDGLFELKRLDTPTGLEMEAEANRKTGDRIELDLKISLRSVVTRLPVPGVTLPVGCPIVNSRNMASSLLTQPGRDYGFLAHPGDGQGVLIVRYRIQEVE